MTRHLDGSVDLPKKHHKTPEKHPKIPQKRIESYTNI